MILAPGQIAALARAAGFAGDDVTTATACALAASGGNPDYDQRAGMPGAGHWCGLWAVNIDRAAIPSSAAGNTPERQATVARWLCDTTGSWDWCDAYRSGAWRTYMQTAATEATREYDPGVPSTPVHAHTLPAALAAWRRRAAATHVDVRHHLRQRRL